MATKLKAIFTSGVINSARKAIDSAGSWIWDLGSVFGVTLISNWDNDKGLVVRKSSAGGQYSWKINLQCFGLQNDTMVTISHERVLDFGNKHGAYSGRISSATQGRIKALINFLACLKKVGQLPQVGSDLRGLANTYGLTVDTIGKANKAFTQFLNGKSESEKTLKKYIKDELGESRQTIKMKKAEPTPTERVVNLGKECEGIGGNSKSIKVQEATTQKTIADLGDDELRNLHSSMLPTWVAVKKEMISRGFIKQVA